MSTIALDWDGTLVDRKWPKMGYWLPGAVDSVRTLLDAGHHCYIYSARLSPFWPNGSDREPSIVMLEEHLVRTMLDSAGLPEVTIWSGYGKPFWDVLVDDKALWFTGRPGSWRATLPKILARIRDEDTFAEVMAVADGV